jgi:hypothetical protein
MKIHMFLHSKVSGWVIPEPGNSLAIHKSQRSNPGEHARIVMLCIQFPAYLPFLKESLFICGIFKDTLNSSDYIVSNGGMINE